MTVSVQNSTVVAIESNGESNSYKSKIDLICRHSECFASGSRSRDGSRMLCGRGAVLDETGQTGVVLFQKWILEINLLQCV